MGGKVPHEEMSQARVQLLADAEAVLNGDKSIDKKQLIRDLLAAAEKCPRVGCATCSFMSKHEAGSVPKEGSP